MDSGRYWEFVVAEMTGWKTVEAMRENMLNEEYIEWRAYYNIKLTVHEKIDYYLAQIALMHSGKKGSKINDFLIKFKSNRRPTPQELKTKMMAWATLHNQANKNKKELEAKQQQKRKLRKI